jgi:hypothetical protein
MALALLLVACATGCSRQDAPDAQSAELPTSRPGSAIAANQSLKTDAAAGGSPSASAKEVYVVCGPLPGCAPVADHSGRWKAKLAWLQTLNSPEGAVEFPGAMEFDPSMSLLAISDISARTRPVGEASGVVFLYRRGEAWTFDSYLTIEPDSLGSAQFGSAISFGAQGTVMAIGASGESAGGQPGTGAVYFFRRESDGSWKRDGGLDGPVDEFSAFGAPLDFDRDARVLAVGAPYKEIHSTENSPEGLSTIVGIGVVHVFTRDESRSWRKVATLSGDKGKDPSRFGNQLALSADGARLAVCERQHEGSDAPTNKRFRVPSGALHVFRSDDGKSWSSETVLLAPNRSGNEAFCAGDLTMSDAGDVIAVGVSGDDAERIDAGRVLIFRRTNSEWRLAESVSSPDPAAGQLFGGGASLTPDGKFLSVADLHGTVYVFEYESSGKWQPMSRVDLMPRIRHPRFGGFLAHDGRTFATMFRGDPSRVDIFELRQ